MPYYDYQCQECNAVMEIRLSISQKEQNVAVNCPECNSGNTKQVFKTVTVIGASSGSSSSSGSCSSCTSCSGGSCSSCG